MSEPIEVITGDWVLRLDGNVVEALHGRSGNHHRWHVAHVAVSGGRRRDELRLTVGVETVRDQITGVRIDVPATDEEAVLGLFAQARSRREALGR